MEIKMVNNVDVPSTIHNWTVIWLNLNIQKSNSSLLKTFLLKSLMLSLTNLEFQLCD